jgi:hypothetical protein
MAYNNEQRRYFWICAVITGLSAFVSSGFSIAAMMGATQHDPLGWYAASRSVSLLIIVLLVILRGSRRGLAAMALTMGFVQLFDTVIGFVQHEPSKTYGPLLFATATFVSVRFLLRESESVLETIGPVR